MASSAVQYAPSLGPLAAACAIGELESPRGDCTLRELSDGLALDALHQLDNVASTSIRLRKGCSLYQAGEPFTALYAIRLGSCKTSWLAEDGREQVVGYHMLGDIIGVDGIGTEQHACEAVALEDSMVCTLPFAWLERLARADATLQHNLHRFLSRSSRNDQAMMLLLGSMQAEQRLAVFLLNLSDRYRERGYSPTEFVLRLTRAEIGSYLGIKLETVSRVFSRFQELRLLEVQGRAVKLVDLPAVRQRAGRCAGSDIARASTSPRPCAAISSRRAPSCDG